MSLKIVSPGPTICTALLVATLATHAADVTVQPASGTGFVVKDAAGANERLRVQESGTITLSGVPAAAAQSTGLCMSGAGLLGPCSGGSGSGPAYTAATGLSLIGTTFAVAPTFQLPQGCAANQIAQWNGTGWVCASASGATLPAGTVNQTLRYDASNAPVANSELQIFADGGVLATDTAVNSALAANGNVPGPGAIPASGKGARMMWYPAKAAFRAGYVNSTQWDDFNIGIYSIAMGFGAKASGDSSAAIGYSTDASGSKSIAMGDFTTADGDQSTAMGIGTIARGKYSTAMGEGARAYGESSTAMGSQTYAGSSANASANPPPPDSGHSLAGNYAVAMGYGTRSTGLASTAMGLNTTASGDYSTAMGYYTVASDFYSIAMGARTNANGFRSTAMGAFTTAGGDTSTAMGSSTTAQGNSSTAMGVNVHADGDYSFAWSGDADISHTNNGTPATGAFYVYAPGGISMYSGAYGSGGCFLSNPGSAGWACSSDRNLKTGIMPVDARAVLDKVVAMPVANWAFKTAPQYRHIGPMAQDFKAAFDLGDADDKYISTTDAQGVALAAIQGLNAKLEEKVAEKDREIALLERRLAAQDETLAALGRQFAELHTQMQALPSNPQSRTVRADYPRRRRGDAIITVATTQ